MAYGFLTNVRDTDTILRTEGTWVGASLGEYSNTPSLGNVLQSITFISGGTFNVWVKKLYINSTVDITILLNITNANGIQALDGVTLVYLKLKANQTYEYTMDRMLLYNQVLQFLFQEYASGTPAAVKFRVSYDGFRIMMNRNMYARRAIKFLGDSITAGANSTTSNTRPFGSWASQIVNNYYGATQDVKGINRAVGGTTAGDIDRASLTNWSYAVNANIVFIALGTNPDSTDQIYQDSINNILNREKVLHPNAWFIVCAPIVKDNAGEVQMVTYRGILQAIVAERANPRVLYLPYDELGILPGVIPSDVHPNQAGHDAMYDFARTFLIENNVTL